MNDFDKKRLEDNLLFLKELSEFIEKNPKVRVGQVLSFALDFVDLTHLFYMEPGEMRNRLANFRKENGL